MIVSEWYNWDGRQATRETTKKVAAGRASQDHKSKLAIGNDTEDTAETGIFPD